METNIIREKRMAIPKVKSEEVFTGKVLIDFITSAMDIRRSMLAALLDVSEKTLANWDECNVKNPPTYKFERLNTLYQVITLAKEKNIMGKKLMTFIHQPIDNDEKFGSLLELIVEEPKTKTIQTIVQGIIQRFSSEG